MFVGVEVVVVVWFVGVVDWVVELVELVEVVLYGSGCDF